jgi:hypothetical protein
MSDRSLLTGLVIVRRLDGTVSGDSPYQRFEVRDERGSAQHAATRIAVVFPQIDNRPWASKLFERLQRLCESRPAQVETPLEWGRTGDGVYILFEKFGDPIGGSNSASNALWRSLEQAAHGLAELHRLDLPHGSLSGDNVLASSNPGEIRVDGAAWGPLAFWSEGKFVDASASEFAAPERKGKTLPPTPRADMYALGRIMMKLVEARRGGRLSRRQRQVIASLTATDPSERPADGDDLLRRMRRADQGDVRRRRLMVGLAFASVLALLATAIVLLWQGNTALQAENADLRHQREVQAKNIVDLRKLVDTQEQNVRQLRERTAELEARLPKKDGPRVPIGLKENEVRVRAEFRWRELARNRDLTFGDMKTAIGSDPGLPREVRDLLETWVRDAEDAAASWWLLPTGGKHRKQDLTSDYLIQVFVNGEKISHGDIPYATDRWYKIASKPDDPIRIILLGPRTWSGAWIRSTLKDQTIRGPVTLWNLYADRYIGDNETWLEFDVDPPPGPPRNAFGVDAIKKLALE